MSMTKKRILLFVITTIVLVMVCSGVLYAFSGACQVLTTDGGIYHSISAHFYANRLTDGSYDTQSGRHIRQCYVRLREKYIPTGQWTQDTGRVYSPAASSSSDGTHYSTYKLMWDTLWFDYVTYSYYGWNAYF